MKPRFRLRLLRRADLEAAVALIALHDRADGYYSRRYFRDTLPGRGRRRARGHVHLAIEARGGRARPRLAGISGLIPDDDEGEGIGWVGWTYVHPDFRGQGLGTRLLEEVFRRARRAGYRKLFLTTSTLPKYRDAVRLYRKLGFRLEGRLTDFYVEGDHQLIFGRRP